MIYDKYINLKSYKLLSKQIHLDLNFKAKQSGIYFLLFNNYVVYVGKSNCIRTRIMTHWNQKVKKFNNIKFITYNELNNEETEYKFISLFEPYFNNAGFGHSTEKLPLSYYKQNIKEIRGFRKAWEHKQNEMMKLYALIDF